ncbi:MAG TPA: hypothetical protein VLZ83_07655 [Edaphocola sp.]|nr:hypothetical protein [Edaphocola sp.]
MKYLKIIFITILLFIIMIIPVNAATLTLPDLPGEDEDYIIFDASSLVGSGIYAITFNNLDNMYVGTYEEYLDLIYPNTSEFTPHSHDILYFRRKVEDFLDIKLFKLVGDEWEFRTSEGGLATYRWGAYGNNSIKNTDILYSSKDVIDLTDGSVFFFKGSWMKAAMARPMRGIIPFLIGLLIVLVGFYKGLSVLSKALRQA